MSYQGGTAAFHATTSSFTIQRILTVSAISRIVCLFSGFIGFICVASATLSSGPGQFYCPIAVVACLVTIGFLLLELKWPDSEMQRMIDVNDIDLYLSAIGALVFMLSSTLLANYAWMFNYGPYTAGAVFGYFIVIACCVNAFWKFRRVATNAAIAANPAIAVNNPNPTNN